MKQIIALLALCCAITLTACHKKASDPVPQYFPSINILSPQAGHIYHNGDTVIVRATVTYDGELHGYEARVTDTVTGAVAFDQAEHVHADSFYVDKYYVASGAQPLTLRLKLSAETDHSGGGASQEVIYYYQP